MTLRRNLQAQIVVALIGLGISLYLTYTYLLNVAPVCGASGGCELVQTSQYAWIGGIPVPMLGAIAYVGLLALAVLALRLEARRDVLTLALFGGSLIGVLFSAYLTYLELFVIHAICRWCVGSAVVMVVMFVLALLAYRQQQTE